MSGAVAAIVARGSRRVVALPPAYTLTIVPVPLSPNHGGNRPLTTGVVIHSTRSGQNWDLTREFASTISWFSNPAAQVSAHAVVDGAGRVGLPVPSPLVGWHDPSSNSTRLGIEVCQPTINRPYTDEQYQATAALVRQWATEYGFPLTRERIVGHEETTSGRAAGKSDPGPAWKWDRFFAFLTSPAGLPTQEPVAGRDEIIRIIRQVADETGMPAVLLLALCIAESNLDPNARRPKNPADDRRYWPDVSSGLAQQTVRWSMEYARLGYSSEYPGPDVVGPIMALYRDPLHSLRVAAPQLRYYLTREDGDHLRALASYNKPNLEPEHNPNTGNYRRALTEARRLLGG